MRPRAEYLPELPLETWEESKLTLHCYVQIVGKIRMALMPRRNHWWNTTLYVGTRGLTTGPMPHDGGGEACEILLDCVGHEMVVTTSRGESRTLALRKGLSVAEFQERLFAFLGELGIHARIVARPYDLPLTRPFAELTELAGYDPEPVARFFRILRWVDAVFTEWAGRFYGKTCPVHLYWHHMDLTVTRFSGRKAPPLPGDRSVADKDAYSHEVVSFGFWAGDENVREPAFYSYTYPSPEGLGKAPLAPAPARWEDVGGSPMAMLLYHDLRKEADPRAALLEFLETAYQAGAGRAGWDISDLTVPSLDRL